MPPFSDFWIKEQKMTRQTVSAFLSDKSDDFRFEMGSRTAYFFYGTKAEFNDFCSSDEGMKMKPDVLKRHIRDIYPSILEPDYTIIIVTGEETGRYRYPGDKFICTKKGRRAENSTEDIQKAEQKGTVIE